MLRYLRRRARMNDHEDIVGECTVRRRIEDQIRELNVETRDARRAATGDGASPRLYPHAYSVGLSQITNLPPSAHTYHMSACAKVTNLPLNPARSTPFGL